LDKFGEKKASSLPLTNFFSITSKTKLSRADAVNLTIIPGTIDLIIGVPTLGSSRLVIIISADKIKK